MEAQAITDPTGYGYLAEIIRNQESIELLLFLVFMALCVLVGLNLGQALTNLTKRAREKKAEADTDMNQALDPKIE